MTTKLEEIHFSELTPGSMGANQVVEELIKNWPEDLSRYFRGWERGFRECSRFYEGEHPRFFYNEDNYRVARDINPEEVARYLEIRDKGCCGTFDTKVVLSSVTILYGFNYGH